jgi:hypothetical protein
VDHTRSECIFLMIHCCGSGGAGACRAHGSTPESQLQSRGKSLPATHALSATEVPLLSDSSSRGDSTSLRSASRDPESPMGDTDASCLQRVNRARSSVRGGLRTRT